LIPYAGGQGVEIVIENAEITGMGRVQEGRLAVFALV
jgi:hypothetical protein